MSDSRGGDQPREEGAVDEPDIPSDATIEIVYTDSPEFRVIHADGAQGGFTKDGNLYFALYTEHASFPKRVVHEITEDQSLGEIVESDKQGDVTRRRECGVLLSYQSLQQLHAWLGEKINEYEQIRQSADDIESE